MCYPIAISLALAAASAVASYAQQSQAQAQQQEQMDYQKDVARANAMALQQQADLERQKGAIEERKVDDELSQLHKQYEHQAGSNRAMLAGRGVELGSGSAEDFLTGQANTFAGDVETNRYNRAMVRWEAEEQARQKEFGASQYNSQASYYNKTVGNTGLSLLTAGLTGASTGLSTYGAIKK